MTGVIGGDGGDGGDLKDGAGQSLGHLCLRGYDCVGILPKAIGVPGFLLKRGGPSAVRERIWHERESGRLQFRSRASDAGRGSGERELCIVPARDRKI